MADAATLRVCCPKPAPADPVIVDRCHPKFVTALAGENLFHGWKPFTFGYAFCRSRVANDSCDFCRLRWRAAGILKGNDFEPFVLRTQL